MRQRPPVSSHAWIQVLTTVLGIVVIGVTLGHLHATAPTVTLDQIEPPSGNGRVDEPGPLTCQRTLPSESVTSGRTRTPVGRIRSAEVVTCPELFDPDGTGGPLVTFVGEVVGDVLEREQGAWTLVNDDAYALGDGPLPLHRNYAGTNSGLSVWIPATELPPDLEPGRHGRRGDILAIRGRINRTDRTDGGGLTLRATDVQVLAGAEPIAIPFDQRQAAAAVIAAAVAVLLTTYYRFSRRP